MDVIPETLAVISLNTIYFYDPNKGECRSPTTVLVAPVSLYKRGRRGVPLSRL